MFPVDFNNPVFQFVSMGTNKLNKLIGKTLTTLTSASSASVGSPSTATTASLTPTNNNSSVKQVQYTGCETQYESLFCMYLCCVLIV